MQLDLNFNVKKPDGTEHTELYQDHQDGKVKSKTVSMKEQLANFLIGAAKHEKISDERAWNFAQQLLNKGIIDTDSEALNEIYEEFKKSNVPIFVKMNLKLAIEEAKKKASESAPAKSPECQDEHK